jgi:DNA polymerase-4
VDEIKKIIHLDLDAFYASVEQRIDSSLLKRPIAVGGNPSGRGVVAAASYEARAFGVRSAMPAKRAKELCPGLIFVKPKFKLYKKISSEIFSIYRQITPLVEPLSLDEAFLDVTENNWSEPLAGKIAHTLKKEIKNSFGLTLSAGVAPLKFVAKIASDYDKPDGCVIVPPNRVDEFIKDLPVKMLWGVGPATENRLHGLGLKKVEDIRSFDREAFLLHFGKFGAFLLDLANGIDRRSVTPHREPKSRGIERTFRRDIESRKELRKVLKELSLKLSESLRKRELFAKTLTLKIRYRDFQTFTRSQTRHESFQSSELIDALAITLLSKQIKKRDDPIRLLGLSASQLEKESDRRQMSFSFEARL